MSGQKINPTNSVKYLGVFLNDSLTSTTHLTNLIPKLNRAIGLLAKIRHYTPKSLLKTIYYSLFNSHFIYACQTRRQTKSNLFHTAPVNKIYKNSKILKMSDYVSLQNVLLVKDCFIANLPETFSKYLVKTEEQHHHKTRSTSRNGAAVQEVNTETYGNDSVKYQSIKTWNTLQKELKNDLLRQSQSKAKRRKKQLLNNLWKHIK